MFIEFTFDPKLFSILLFPAFREISKIIGNLYLTKTNNFFDIFRIFLSFEFSFIFLLIFKCKNKSNKKEIIHDENENKEEKSPIILLYDERIKAEKKNKVALGICPQCGGNLVTRTGEYNQEIKGETNVEIIPVIA